MRAFAAVFAREVQLNLRLGAGTPAALLFFVVVVSLFPLAIGPSPALLAHLAPGIIWVAALLSSLLPLDRLFAADFEDGSLDQLLLSGLHPAGIAFAKTLAHWLSTGAPVVLMAAPLAIMLHLPPPVLPVLLAGLALGSAGLSLLGTAAAAIVLGARRGAILLPVLVLPLATPLVIFGAASADAAGAGLPYAQHLLLLGAFLASSLPLLPLVAGWALREAAAG